MTTNSRILTAALRNDLPSFIQKSFNQVAPGQVFASNWHIEAIAWHLEQCRLGHIKRLLITMPPRHLKSIAASVAYPAWLLGHDPHQRIICVSYSNELASKHAGDCRALMQSGWYRHLFPGTRLSQDKNTEMNFVTNERGYRYSTSVGGTLTGRGGNTIIIDDALKPGDALSKTKRQGANDWFDQTCYSRLDDKANDVIIIIMQRLHIEDLAGHVLQSDGWTHLNLPAIADDEKPIPIGFDRTYARGAGELLHPAREPQAVLDDLKSRLGSYQFSAQYQQNPIPEDGEVIHWNWFQWFDSVSKGRNYRIVQSWDTASKPEEHHDYSVCTTWLIKGNEYYLLHILRERLDYPTLKRRIIKHAKDCKARVILIEDKGSGTGLIQDLRRERNSGIPKPIAVVPKQDKFTRMQIQTAKIEAGQVFLPRGKEWLADFRDEVLQFPNGRYDDQVDSMAQFLNWAEKRRSGRIVVVPLHEIL